MNFQPVLVGSGLLGWQFLKTTLQRQQQTFNDSAVTQRETKYFSENISTVNTAEELVADRRLLSFTLDAFGLQDDINNKFFITKILKEGTIKQDSLANKLSDERYRSLARAFAFDSALGPRTQRGSFISEIVSQYQRNRFQFLIGKSDEVFRLALNFETGIEEIARSKSSPNSMWFRLMGTPPLRTVLETALALPKGFGQLDIDRQLDIFRDKMDNKFGVREILDLDDNLVKEKIIRSYLLQTEIQNFSSLSTESVALNLLQAIPRNSILNKF